MTDNQLRAAAELVVRAYSLGARKRYAALDTAMPELRAALAASAPDEGPDPAECAICGDYVADGQPVHNICVAELTAKAEDARPAAPEALDVERLIRSEARIRQHPCYGWQERKP